MLPPSLTRGAACTNQAVTESHWGARSLVLTQMCGFTFSKRVMSPSAAPPKILATPVYKFPGCESSGTHCGFVIVRDNDCRDELWKLAGARLALNHYGSFSGCLALRAAVASIFPAEELDDSQSITFFDPHHVVTGAHWESLRAVRDGRADLCCVDCISWALLSESAPSELKGLRGG